MTQGESQAIDIAIRRRALLVLSGFAILWAMAGSTGIADVLTGRVLFAVTAAGAAPVAVVAVRPGWLRPAVRERRRPDDWSDRLRQVLLDDRAALGERGPERWLVGQSLHPGVDQP